MDYPAYSEEVDKNQLMQGDILLKTDELSKLIEEIHPHYSREEYSHFQILTQSCDLVRRGSSKSCSAKYITIAAVRNVHVVVQREVERRDRSNLLDVKSEGVKLLPKKSRSSIENFLNSLVNNNNKEHFFLKSKPDAGLDEDSCTFLYLSVAVKADLHYEKCLEAKILQLNEVFQSKLGWMVGNLYSRVGTPDYVNASGFVQDMLDSLYVWVDDRPFREIKKINRTSPDESVENLGEKAQLEIEKLFSKSCEDIARQIIAESTIGKADLGVLVEALKKSPRFKKIYSASN